MGSRHRPCAAEAHEYVVGRNAAGEWIAREIHGLGGGIFTSREAAIHFAAFESHRPVGTVRLSRRPVELDLR